MCEICNQSPCATRCPNSPGPRAIEHCTTCAEELYDGDTAYKLPNGDLVCEDCMQHMKVTVDVI